MQLPKYKKKKRIKLKICQYCGKEFWGHPIAKYCELHRDVKQREKSKKTPEPIDVNNKEFQHELLEVREVEFTCELEGCGSTYTVKVFPKQFVYPRYCEDHRNEFKRKNYIRLRMVQQMMAQRKAMLARSASVAPIVEEVAAEAVAAPKAAKAPSKAKTPSKAKAKIAA